MIPPLPLGSGDAAEAAASEMPLFMPLSATFLSGTAGAGENIAVKGDPNLYMTDLKRQNGYTREHFLKMNSETAYSTEDMRDESGEADGGGSRACGGGGVRKSGLAPLASIGCLYAAVKDSGLMTVLFAPFAFESAVTGARMLLRW